MKPIRERTLTNIIPLPIEEGLFHFEWLEHFDESEKVEFLLELFNVVSEAKEKNNWEQVVEVIEDWKATANINADAYVVESIEQSEKEFAEGKGISWRELKEYLNL
ncbi:hypothetical protein H8E77_13665 [bacterium]|nr:hypothetical protein [bacterium]